MNVHQNPMRTLVCPLFFAGAVALGGNASGQGAEPIDFNRDIRPILSDGCFLCHGPDEQTRKAELRLDTFAGATKKHEDAAAIVPGKPAESEVYRRIMSTDADERMPPAKHARQLSQREKELLGRWIAEGARYQTHWSFAPLGSPKPPPVSDTDWPTSPIDRFVLVKLRQAGLKPAPAADRETWLRRVTLDLTGLPPTPKEIDAFLADNDAKAFERVVDRLLQSPRYGERMAMDWLDVARYADSFGYQADLDTQAWPWRDWVISAFNRNLPFDQFILWQLAGDLLPHATREQKLATAFNRIHRKTQEGGSVEEEFRLEGIADRVHTFGSAFLGLTFECARCHDHKYDPLTMGDYYSLSAFFNNIDEWGLLHGNGGIQPHPTLYLPSEAQEKQLQQKQAEVSAGEKHLTNVLSSREAAFREWLSKLNPATVPTWADHVGAFPLESETGGAFANLANPKLPGRSPAANRLVAGKKANALGFTGDDALDLPPVNAGNCEDPVSVAFWLRPGENYPRAVVVHNSDGWDPGYNGYELLLENGKLRWMVAREWPGNCIAIQTKATLPTGEWTHVVVTYDGSRRAAGLRIALNGALADCAVLRDHLAKNNGSGGKISFGERRRDSGLRNGAVDEVHLFDRAITELEIATLNDEAVFARIVALPVEKRTSQVLQLLRDYYFSALDAPAREAALKLRAARSAWRAVMDGVAEIPVMAEMPAERPAYILSRGAYDAPRTKQAPRDTPASLPPFPADAPKNRLGLARWLLTPDHPLTARVTMNRIWQLFFGRGLVATTENFGVQGANPTHAELLDWLARDLIASGWDLKRMVKQIVLSSTYRQRSSWPESRRLDPENALLSRGPSRRLPAEFLRDAALQAGNLLVNKVGGPPVKPYAPGDLWRATNSFLPAYTQDKGEGLYRRSIYTFWRRTSPPPNMLTFDAPGREVCQVRRQTTNTPLQPLVLLNDPQWVEAARLLGERMLREGGASLEERLAYGFRWATSRAPTVEERALVRELFVSQREQFAKSPGAALKYLAVGETPAPKDLDPLDLAAAAATATAFLNLDAATTSR